MEESPLPQIPQSHVVAVENSGIWVVSYSTYIQSWPVAMACKLKTEQ